MGSAWNNYRKRVSTDKLMQPIHLSTNSTKRLRRGLEVEIVALKSEGRLHDLRNIS